MAAEGSVDRAVSYGRSEKSSFVFPSVRPAGANSTDPDISHFHEEGTYKVRSRPTRRSHSAFNFSELVKVTLL